MRTVQRKIARSLDFLCSQPQSNILETSPPHKRSTPENEVQPLLLHEDSRPPSRPRTPPLLLPDATQQYSAEPSPRRRKQITSHSTPAQEPTTPESPNIQLVAREEGAAVISAPVTASSILCMFAAAASNTVAKNAPLRSVTEKNKRRDTTNSNKVESLQLEEEQQTKQELDLQAVTPYKQDQMGVTEEAFDIDFDVQWEPIQPDVPSEDTQQYQQRNGKEGEQKDLEQLERELSEQREKREQEQHQQMEKERREHEERERERQEKDRRKERKQQEREERRQQRERQRMEREQQALKEREQREREQREREEREREQRENEQKDKEQRERKRQEEQANERRVKQKREIEEKQRRDEEERQRREREEAEQRRKKEEERKRDEEQAQSEVRRKREKKRKRENSHPAIIDLLNGILS